MSPSKTKMLKTSPAKINLFLYLVGRDEQSHHKLQSLFVTLHSLYDVMHFEESDELEIVSDIKDNIIEKAARSCNVNNMKISLTKNIPIGAGLGGGSSNAATTLLEIGRRYNLTRDELISKKIGHDVEFFLYEENALYFSCNEVNRVNLGLTLNILIVKPDFSINTRDVYDIARQEISSDDLHPIVDIDNLKHYIFSGENQLYNFALKINGNLQRVIEELYSNSGILVARMTGSGSSCFGIFNSEIETIAAGNRIKAKYDKWFTHSTKLYI